MADGKSRVYSASHSSLLEPRCCSSLHVQQTVASSRAWGEGGGHSGQGERGTGGGRESSTWVGR